MTYSASERSLRDHTYALSLGLLTAAGIQAMLEHPHGLYAWQVEFMAAELVTAFALLAALFGSRRK